MRVLWGLGVLGPNKVLEGGLYLIILISLYFLHLKHQLIHIRSIQKQYFGDKALWYLEILSNINMLLQR